MIDGDTGHEARSPRVVAKRGRGRKGIGMVNDELVKRWIKGQIICTYDDLLQAM